jgi:hypothetical protein
MTTIKVEPLVEVGVSSKSLSTKMVEEGKMKSILFGKEGYYPKK